MIISVHIPKCGGTSFRSILKNHFDDRLLLDYDDKPMAKGSLSRNLSALLKMPDAIVVCKEYDCIHGHFLPIKYRFVRKAKRIIWLRDPAQRLASRYSYWKARASRTETKQNRIIKNSNTTFEEFCQIPHFQNLYAKYLWGTSLDEFDFVGITERYNESIEAFYRMFDFIPQKTIPKLNENKKKKSDSYPISSTLLREIRRLNNADYKYYEKALDLNEKMLARF